MHMATSVREIVPYANHSIAQLIES